MTSCAVVLVVGAKLFGQTSFSTKELKTKSAFFPKKELGFPVIAISGFPLRFRSGVRTLISGVFPLLERQITMSFS